MDLQLRGAEFVVAQSQISVQSLFGVVEVDALFPMILHFGCQLILLLAQFLQSSFSPEHLKRTANKMKPLDQFYNHAATLKKRKEKKNY